MSSSKKRHLSSSSKSPSSQSPLHKRFSIIPSSTDSESDMATMTESSAFDSFMREITNISHTHESESEESTESDVDENKDYSHSELTTKQMWTETQKSIHKLSKKVDKKAKSDLVLVKYVKSVVHENVLMKNQIQQLIGENTRLKQGVNKLTSSLENLQLHEMSNNMIISGIPETPGENCKSKVYDFLISTMCIPRKYLYSHDNIIGEIRIDIAHRIGKLTTYASTASQKTKTTRPIVVKFLSRAGKDIVMSHRSNLKDKKFKVSDQLPNSMRERRIAQIPSLIELRKIKDNKVTLNKDVLVCNSKVVQPKFSQNPLQPCRDLSKTVSFEQLEHTHSVSENKSVFQAHCKITNSLTDASAARDSLLQSQAVAQRDHLIYAYRIKDKDSEMIIEGNSDDGEWNASIILANLLRKRDCTGVFLCVSRKFGGTHLGPDRFRIIEKVASEALNSVLENQ